MSHQNRSGSSVIMTALVSFLTVAQVGASGVLFYFILNEMNNGRGPDNMMLNFILLTIVIVDLYILNWLVKLVDLTVQGKPKSPPALNSSSSFANRGGTG